ncbi:MAG: transcriptional repressor [Oscillospiraceae bacterium]|nr:transcriptional repressor [Oscillospiraceae bacterium]MBP3521096.1 transcriptional repressor [Oscillospiraceae bacterium]
MAGKRYSRQRELIYQAVKNSPEHPTAEMVFQWLKPENPGLSLGTVYRNLNLLSQEGALRRMPFPVERYDACVEPHTHLRCETCGRVVDLKLDYDAAMDALAAQAQPGVRILRHDLTFYGLCEQCREETKDLAS